MWRLGVSQESIWVGPRVPLVPVLIGQPNCHNLKQRHTTRAETCVTCWPEWCSQTSASWVNRWGGGLVVAGHCCAPTITPANKPKINKCNFTSVFWQMPFLNTTLCVLDGLTQKHQRVPACGCNTCLFLHTWVKLKKSPIPPTKWRTPPTWSWMFSAQDWQDWFWKQACKTQRSKG